MREKMRLRAIGAVLAAGLLASVSAPPAMAAEASPVTAVSAFEDVPADSWCAGAVAYVHSRGLMKGVAAETFAPDRTLTRAMFVTVFARLAGVRTENYGDSGFTDVKSGSWCSGAISWAEKYGIVSGRTAAVFGTNRAVTREQAAAMISRALDGFRRKLPETGDAPAFADMETVSAFAGTGVEQMRKTGILRGDANGNFRPKELLTRGQAASVFMRISQMVEAVTAEADRNARLLTAANAPCTVKERVLLCDFRNDIRYPEISGLVSAEHQQAWNTVFLKNAEAEKKALSEEGCEVADTFTVTQADAGLLSVIEDCYTYMDGGMHGTSARFSWNFDMATGKQVKLSDRCDTDAIAKAVVSGRGYDILTAWGESAESNGLSLDEILLMSGCEKTRPAVKAMLDRFDSRDPMQTGGYAYWADGRPCLVLSVSHAAGDFCVIRMDAACARNT